MGRGLRVEVMGAEKLVRLVCEVIATTERARLAGRVAGMRDAADIVDTRADRTDDPYDTELYRAADDIRDAARLHGIQQGGK